MEDFLKPITKIEALESLDTMWTYLVRVEENSKENGFKARRALEALYNLRCAVQAISVDTAYPSED